MSLSSLYLLTLRFLYYFNEAVFPHWSKWPTFPIIRFPLGLIQLIIHRGILDRENLLPAPLPPPLKEPGPDLKYWPDNGYGVDRINPEAAAQGSPYGLNMPAVPVVRRHVSLPQDVQFLAEKLLARQKFKPAGAQLNVMAAAWVQTMVHDWVFHYLNDAVPPVVLNKGAEYGCPMKTFKFKPTLQRKGDDGTYNNSRTAWWDASFLYGQDEEHANMARTFKDGLLKVNNKNPDTLPVNENDVIEVGDQQNSWVGVALLQELFLKEHNAVAREIAKNNPELAGNDNELFHRARLVVAAVVAKVHTVDWTCQLLNTYTLNVGMNTNWYGIFKALNLPKWLNIFGEPLSLIGKDHTNTFGVPYCLTEEFVAVYRLHPLLPDGLLIDEDGTFFSLTELFAQKGQAVLRSAPERPQQLLNSVLKYPCGSLELHNYPAALRQLNPTALNGEPLPDSEQIDLAALELYRDRERGIQRYNDFRRALQLRPMKNFDDLTSYMNHVPNPDLVKSLVEAYGVNGIEDVDLLVGCLAEDKITGFAISETSFTIFLLMASRRLETDPFLNEKFTDEVYSSTGKAWVTKTLGLRDVLERHYPKVAKNIPPGQSAFTPYGKWPSKYTDM